MPAPTPTAASPQSKPSAAGAPVGARSATKGSAFDPSRRSTTSPVAGGVAEVVETPPGPWTSSASPAPAPAPAGRAGPSAPPAPSSPAPPPTRASGANAGNAPPPPSLTHSRDPSSSTPFSSRGPIFPAGSPPPVGVSTLRVRCAESHSGGRDAQRRASSYVGLLRKADGFEGLCSVAKHPLPDDLARSESPDAEDFL